MTIEQDLYTRVYQYKGYWKLTVQQHGQRKSFYSKIPGNAGRKECARQAAAWLAQDTPIVPSSRLLVKDVFPLYLKDRALQTKDIYTIQKRYENHIEPVIGHIALMQLRQQDLVRVVNSAYAKSDLSYKTLLHLRGDLSGFCKYLYRSGLRNDLRTDIIKVPRQAKRGTKRALTPQELHILFTHSKTYLYNEEVDDEYIYAYRFHVLYGLRPGELMGLEWEDIERDGIHIRRSINEKHITTSGKNEFAPRVLPLTVMARELLREQLKYRSPSRDPKERVFGDLHEVTYRWRWHLYCKYNGIAHITPYELRHTFATINKFLPTWILDELMGHVHSGVSLGVYAHSLENDMDKVGPQLDANLKKLLDLGKEETEKEANESNSDDIEDWL